MMDYRNKMMTTDNKDYHELAELLAEAVRRIRDLGRRMEPKPKGEHENAETR